MLTCSKCRSVQRPAPFCSTCGASLLVGGTMPAIPPPPVHTRSSGMAITGFVLSFFCGVLGLIFSIIGFRECKKSQGKVTGEGLALAGMVISVLTMIGTIYAYVAFTRFVTSVSSTARSWEARSELRQIERRVRTYYTENGALPKRLAPMTPPVSCCLQPGERCRNTNWDTPAWRDLGFEIYGSHHFRYSYTSTPEWFEATATGDLDCDGDEITYTLRIDVKDGYLDHTISDPVEDD